MLYYRYRPYSELSLKELLYSEMYFTSPEECNDPFDSKAFYEFPVDKEKWRKLVEYHAKTYKIEISSELFEKILDNVSSKCPMTYYDAIKKNIFYGIDVSEEERILLRKLGKQINNTFKVHKPEIRHFVSFSKSEKEPLMWSHYADKHNGFCLIFKSINGGIYQTQDKKYKKNSIKGVYSDGLQLGFPVDVPDNFTLTKIIYEPVVKPLSAFDYIPAYYNYIMGEGGNDEDKKNGSHYLQKHKNWEYEEEYRLILPPPFQQLGEVQYTKQDRLFHYEPTQLVGIIFGTRMPSVHKDRIIEIIHERNRWTKESVNYKRVFFDFVLFDAQMSSTQRVVDVVPSSIISYETFKPYHFEFSKRLELWHQGWGRELIGTQGKEVFIK